MIKVIFAGAFWFAATSAAFAQTPTETPPPAEAPPAAIDAQCPLPPDPEIAGSNASQRNMTRGNTAYGAWLEQARAALECRRAYYNAAIQRLNSVNAAWNSEIDTYCARPRVRCEPIQRQPEESPMQ